MGDKAPGRRMLEHLLTPKGATVLLYPDIKLDRPPPCTADPPLPHSTPHKLSVPITANPQIFNQAPTEPQPTNIAVLLVAHIPPTPTPTRPGGARIPCGHRPGRYQHASYLNQHLATVRRGQREPVRETSSKDWSRRFQPSLSALAGFHCVRHTHTQQPRGQIENFGVIRFGFTARFCSRRIETTSYTRAPRAADTLQ